MENEWILMFRQVCQPSVTASSTWTHVTPPAISTEQHEDRQTIEIYRAVLRRLFGSDRVSGGGIIKPLVFILYSEIDTPADSDSLADGRPLLPETIRRGIIRGSGDLPLRIVWIEDFYGVGCDLEGEYVPSKGAVIRFTGIRREKTDLALVEGSIHRCGLPTRGFECVVEKKSGFWMVRSSYNKWIR